MNTVKQRRNKSHRTYHTDPTQEAVLGYPKPMPKPKDKTPDPTGGIIIAPEAQQACTTFGMHPYQVAEIIRQASRSKRDHFTYQGREIDLADNGQVVIIQRVH